MNQIYSMLNDIKTDPDSYEREELSEVDQKRILKDLKTSGRLDSGCTQSEAGKIRSHFQQSGTDEIGSHHQQTGTGKASRSSFLKAGAGNLASAAICGFIAVIMIGGIAYADEIQAAARSASCQIASYLGIEKELDDYVTVVSTSRSSKGYTVTLNEVILDHDELLVSSTVQSAEKMDDGLHASANIYINGKRASESAGGSLRKIDEQTLESVISYKLNEQYTADPLDFEIKYDFTSPEGKEINGNWDFLFKASGTALAADTIHIPLQVSYRLPNGELIQLTEFTSNSIGSKIYFQSAEPSKEVGRSYDMNLEGTDQMGNKVIFYLSYRNQESGAFKLSEPLLDTTEVLTLQPYSVAFPEKSGRLSNDFKPVGESFDLSLDR